jgi:hypothetical protein
MPFVTAINLYDWIKHVNWDEIPEELEEHTRSLDFNLGNLDEKSLVESLRHLYGKPREVNTTKWNDVAETIAEAFYEIGLQGSDLGRYNRLQSYEDAAEQDSVDLEEMVDDLIAEYSRKNIPTAQDKMHEQVDRVWYEVIDLAEKLREGNTSTLNRLSSIPVQGWENGYTPEQMDALGYAVLEGFGPNELEQYTFAVRTFKANEQRSASVGLEIMLRGLKKGSHATTDTAARALASCGATLQLYLSSAKIDRVNAFLQTAKLSESVKLEVLDSTIHATYDPRVDLKKMQPAALADIKSDHEFLQDEGFELRQAEGSVVQYTPEDGLEFKRFLGLYVDEEDEGVVLFARISSSLTDIYVARGSIEEPFGYLSGQRKANLRRLFEATPRGSREGSLREVQKLYKKMVHREVTKPWQLSVRASTDRKGSIEFLWDKADLRKAMEYLGIRPKTMWVEVIGLHDVDHYQKKFAGAIERTATSMDRWVKHVTWDDIPDELEQKVREDTRIQKTHGHDILRDFLGKHNIDPPMLLEYTHLTRQQWEDELEEIADRLYDEASLKHVDIKELKRDGDFNDSAFATLLELIQRSAEAQHPGFNAIAYMNRALDNLAREERPTVEERTHQFVEERWYDLIDEAIKLRKGDVRTLKFYADGNAFQQLPVDDMRKALLYAIKEGFQPSDPVLYDFVENQYKSTFEFDGPLRSAEIGGMLLEMIKEGVATHNGRIAGQYLQLLGSNRALFKDKIDAKKIDALVRWTKAPMPIVEQYFTRGFIVEYKPRFKAKFVDNILYRLLKSKQFKVVDAYIAVTWDRTARTLLIQYANVLLEDTEKRRYVYNKNIEQGIRAHQKHQEIEIPGDVFPGRHYSETYTFPARQYTAQEILEKVEGYTWSDKDVERIWKPLIKRYYPKTKELITIPAQTHSGRRGGEAPVQRAEIEKAFKERGITIKIKESAWTWL